MSTIIESTESLGTSAGLLIGRHMESTLRMLMRGDGVVSDPGYLQCVTGEPHPLGNFSFVSNPHDQKLTSEAINGLPIAGAPSAVIFPDQESEDVADFLVTQGFMMRETIPCMAIDIAQLPSTTLPDGYDFVRIVDGSKSTEWSKTLSHGYDLPPRICDYFSPSGCEFDQSAQWFAVTKNGTPVATSLMSFCDGMPGVYCVATLPEERGKGLGSHVTAEPLRLAGQFGYKVGVLQASDAGHPVYKRLGFRDFGEVPLFLRIPD